MHTFQMISDGNNFPLTLVLTLVLTPFIVSYTLLVKNRLSVTQMGFNVEIVPRTAIFEKNKTGKGLFFLLFFLCVHIFLVLL